MSPSITPLIFSLCRSHGGGITRLITSLFCWFSSLHELQQQNIDHDVDGEMANQFYDPSATVTTRRVSRWEGTFSSLAIKTRSVRELAIPRFAATQLSIAHAISTCTSPWNVIISPVNVNRIDIRVHDRSPMSRAQPTSSSPHLRFPNKQLHATTTI